MSTITKEWLQQTISEMEEHRDLFPGDLDDNHENVLAALRIALASLEAEPVVSHVGSKNALDAIVAFIKSNRNPTLKDHNEVSERLFQDNCHGLSSHVIEYIKQIGEELEELRSAQDSAPPAPESVTDYPETLPCPVMLEPGLRFGKGVPTRTMLGALQRRAEHYAELEAMTPEQRAEHDAGMNELAAMLQGADVSLTHEGKNHHEDKLGMVNHLGDVTEKVEPVTQIEPVADLYGLTSPTGGETSFTFDAVEARDFIDGGWLCQEYVELERFQEAITNHTEDKLAMVDHSGDSNNMIESVTTACELRDAVDAIRNSGIAIDGEKILAERDALNSQVIPDGWKLVPIDPTKDMLRAGQSVVGFWLNTVHCYSKMLAAAPAAPHQEDL
ncbi:TPA: hypothetical protein ACHINJ_002793 [Enterobacter roggenkampii]